MSEFGRFLVVGVANSAIGYAVIFGLMLGLRWSPEASNVAGYAVGLSVSFLLNRFYTFRSRAKPIGEAARFLIVFGLSFALNLAVLTFLVRVVGTQDWLAQVIAGAAYVTASYALNRLYVFSRPHRGT